jgi:hypothetical protein
VRIRHTLAIAGLFLAIFFIAPDGRAMAASTCGVTIDSTIQYDLTVHLTVGACGGPGPQDRVQIYFQGGPMIYDQEETPAISQDLTVSAAGTYVLIIRDSGDFNTATPHWTTSAVTITFAPDPTPVPVTPSFAPLPTHTPAPVTPAPTRVPAPTKSSGGIVPTASGTAVPTASPSNTPSATPSDSPSDAPSESPAESPTASTSTSASASASESPASVALPAPASGNSGAPYGVLVIGFGLAVLAALAMVAFFVARSKKATKSAAALESTTVTTPTESPDAR